MARQVVGPGKVVTVAYELKDDEGDVIDTSEDSEPLIYLHGAGNVVDGIENALRGKAVGDRLSVVVPPEDGYGERDEAGVQEVPRKSFDPEAELEVGALFMTEDDSGNPIPFWVVEVAEETVVVDLNHPLAGETLHVRAEVLAIRDATPEEREHGHSHEAPEHVCADND